MIQSAMNHQGISYWLESGHPAGPALPFRWHFVQGW